MAINQTNKQIKTPQSSPTPPQSNTSVSPQDLNLLKNLQNETSQLIYQLGQIQIEKYRAEERENQMKQKLIELQKKEKEIAQTLTNKYGKGSINPATGEFIPLS